jgi:hypothetical protein
MRVAFSFFLATLLLVSGCDTPSTTPPANILTGTGNFTFTGYAPLADKPIACFYHIPAGSTATTPVFMVVHGTGRDGKALRDALISTANQLKIIVLAPEFSETHYPGSNVFNLANIFVDGENPSPQTLNPESIWTFKVFDPIFADFKSFSGNATAQYDIFGHSAGAQLVHRFLQFTPNAKFNRLITSAAGWYMMPDATIRYPYGLKDCPAEAVNSADYFARKTYVMVGALDTDPNSFNLRHTPQADVQGNNRLERARHFYQEAFAIAGSKGQPFLWQYVAVPNVGHDGNALASAAANMLY